MKTDWTYKNQIWLGYQVVGFLFKLFVCPAIIGVAWDYGIEPLTGLPWITYWQAFLINCLLLILSAYFKPTTLAIRYVRLEKEETKS